MTRHCIQRQIFCVAARLDASPQTERLKLVVSTPAAKRKNSHALGMQWVEPSSIVAARMIRQWPASLRGSRRAVCSSAWAVNHTAVYPAELELIARRRSDAVGPRPRKKIATSGLTALDNDALQPRKLDIAKPKTLF